MTHGKAPQIAYVIFLGTMRSEEDNFTTPQHDPVSHSVFCLVETLQQNGVEQSARDEISSKIWMQPFLLLYLLTDQCTPEEL